MSAGLSSSFDADEWLVTPGQDPYGYSPIEYNDGPFDYFNITHDPNYDYPDSQFPPLVHTPQCDPESPEQVVSRAFHPDALINGFPPDKLVVSSDNTRFFVHSFVVSVTPLLQEDPTKVGDDAVVLNIILHTLYNMSCAPYQPSLHSLGKALDRLALYGMDPEKYIVPTKPTFDVLTSHAPYLPLDLYTLAARFNLYELASVASSHLLSLKLSSLSDDACSQIGSRYLVRLFNLHLYRMSALKDIIITPPNRHQATSSCKAKEQDVMVGEWAMVVAYLSRDASPAMSSSLLVSQFRPVTASITCSLCKQNVNTRLDLLSAQWSTVKCTI